MDCKENLTYVFAFQDVSPTPSKPTTEPDQSANVNIKNAVDDIQHIIISNTSKLWCPLDLFQDVVKNKKNKLCVAKPYITVTCYYR